MTRTIALATLAPEAENGGQELLGGHRAVPGLRRLQTGIAVAARGNILPEVRQQLLTTTIDGFAQPQHGIQLPAGTPLEVIIAIRLIYHATLLHHVLQA